MHSFPDSSRLKIFHTERPLSESESALMRQEIQKFLQHWQTHRQNLRASFEWKYQQFLVLAIDESCVALSGCSQDSLTHEIQRIGTLLGLRFLNSPPICYREGQNIHCIERDLFRKRVKDGLISEETIVFDTTLEHLGAFRAGKWELPFKESWHSRAFRLPHSLKTL
jgi:hypothetical protein